MDLRGPGCKLTSHQRVGLELFDDLYERMGRNEAAEIKAADVANPFIEFLKQLQPNPFVVIEPANRVGLTPSEPLPCLRRHHMAGFGFIDNEWYFNEQ